MRTKQLEKTISSLNIIQKSVGVEICAYKRKFNKKVNHNAVKYFDRIARNKNKFYFRQSGVIG